MDTRANLDVILGLNVTSKQICFDTKNYKVLPKYQTTTDMNNTRSEFWHPGKDGAV